MKKIMIIAFILSMSATSFSGSYKIKLSATDTFVVEAPSPWTLRKEKYKKYDRAWFSVKPKDKSFVLQMFFKKVRYQTSQENLKKTTVRLGSKYVPKCIENAVHTKTIDLDGGLGVYATFTDKEVDKSDPGDFPYISVGSISLSDDIELSFIMLTHEIGGETQKNLMKYMAGFIK